MYVVFNPYVAFQGQKGRQNSSRIYRTENSMINGKKTILDEIKWNPFNHRDGRLSSLPTRNPEGPKEKDNIKPR